MNLVHSLFLKQIGESSTVFEQTVSSYLASAKLPSQEQLDEFVEECHWEESLFSNEDAIDNWKRLLALNLFCHLVSLDDSILSAKIRSFERHPWDQNAQYFRVIIALNHAFSRLPIPEVGVHLLESGAALIDLHAYSPWLSLPYTPQHFELGVFLCLLSLLCKRDDLKTTVLRIAHWQLNTLNAHARPLPGLFVREKEGHTLHHLCSSYLLFRSAAILDEETSFAAIADVTLQGIHDHLLRTGEKIDVLWVLIDKWLNQYPSLSHEPVTLSEHIYDPSTALVGYRTAEQHVVCTLHGVQTGLGEIRQGDIEVVTYGPQYLPLGDCQGFGIEGNALSDHGARRSTIQLKRNSFVLKGCTRLLDQPSPTSCMMGKFRGIWLEVEQEYKKPHFRLKTTVLGLDGWEGVAFSFFVKAPRCKIHSRILYPRTLERYEGEGTTLFFEGLDGSIELTPFSFTGKMEIIPLAGENDFWGADFLVAYHFASEQSHYQWQLSLISAEQN